MTIEDLGRAYKKANPRVRHLSDAEAGRAAKAAYPNEYADFTDTALTFQQPSPLESINFGLDTKIQSLIKRHNPDMGVFISWIRRRKLEEQNKYLDASTEQQIKLIAQAVTLAKEIIEGKRREVEFNTFLAQNRYVVVELEARGKMITDAAASGMYPDDYSSWKRFEYEFNLEEEVAESQHKRELERERQQSILRTQEAAAKAKIESDNEIMLAQEQFRLSVIAKNLTNHQMLISIQDMIDQEYINIERVMENPKIPEGAKKRIVQSRQRMIEMFEKQQHETQAKILQQR